MFLARGLKFGILFSSVILLLVLLPGSVFGETVSDQATQAVKEYILKEKPEWQEAKILISFKYAESVFEDLGKIKGELDFKVVASPEKALAGSVILPLEVWQEDELKEKINLHTDIAVSREVILTVRKIKKGEAFSEEDIKFAEKDITYLPPEVLTDKALVLGEEATTFLPKNTVLLDYMVRSVPLIKRGDKVVIIGKIGKIKVVTQGVALKDGYLGEEIRVRNIDSRKEIEAKVLNPEEVEVKVY